MALTHKELGPEEREALPKARRLLYDVTRAHDRADGEARRLRIWITACRCGAVLCAVVACVSGFLAMVPQIAHVIRIQPFMVSAAAIAGMLVQAIEKGAGWQAKSDAYHRHRHALRNLLLRVEYETASTDDGAIATLSQEFRQESDRLRENLSGIGSVKDDPKGEGEQRPQPGLPGA